MGGEKFKIVVPVYNGAGLIRRFHAHVPEEYHSQLVYINDGSTDNTEDIINELNCKHISHASNEGKGKAIATGVKFCMEEGVEYMVVIDVDLQHPPEDLHKFMAFDTRTLQLGYRRDRKAMPLHRKISNFLTSLFISVRTNTVIKDSQCGFRAFPVTMVKELDFVSGGFQYESEMLIRGALKGYRVVHRTIPVIYADEPTQMNNFKDTVKFTILWFRSFFWT